MSDTIPPLTEKDGESKDLVAENIEKLKQLFPEIVTDGKVDFETLEEVLGNFKEDSQERYSFTWNGKSKARKLAMTPSRGTLRPAPEESVNWDNTDNLFIEGDNLEVLKLLQRSYHRKVKLIYIDPPYNTGNEFVYNDTFFSSLDDYLKITKQKGENGDLYSSNPEYSGRYHTDWLNMMYPRLLLGRELLKDDGVIFISISTEELANLTKICNEIYGEDNHLGTITRVSKTTSFQGNFFASSFDYLLCYGKDSDQVSRFSDKVDESQYPKTEKEGPRKGEKYRDDIAFYLSTQTSLRPNQKYFVECPDGTKVIPPCSIQDEKMRPGDGRWRWTKEKYLNDKHLLSFKKTKTSPLLDENGEQAKWNVYTKSYLSDKKEKGNLPRDLFKGFLNRSGSKDLKELDIPFDFPKPVDLIKYLFEITNLQSEDIVLDFFAGSGTTAHAVIKFNAEENENLKFINVQLPEPTDKKSKAHREGYESISSLAKERIRRALKKYESSPESSGFKVLNLDTSNLKPWDSNFDEVQLSIEDSIENIKPDRSEQDVLYEILLKYGLDLSIPIEEKEIAGSKVFVAGAGALFICLAPNIDLDVVEGIAKLKEVLEPELTRVVFRDSGFKDDVLKTNAVQILKQHGIEDVRSI